jgi:hypothetical protein
MREAEQSSKVHAHSGHSGDFRQKNIEITIAVREMLDLSQTSIGGERNASILT